MHNIHYVTLSFCFLLLLFFRFVLLFVFLFVCLFFLFRAGEPWSRLRKALAPKMLRPKDIRDNLENFNSVTWDAIEHLVSIRGGDMEIPDLDKELAKWATECKSL